MECILKPAPVFHFINNILLEDRQNQSNIDRRLKMRCLTKIIQENLFVR
jgi:hypothetical protein